MRTLTENYVIDAVSPQLVDNAALGSGWILMDATEPVLFLLRVGATDTTVDAKIQQATASDGTGAKDLTGAAITQISATGDNRHVSIEVEPARMDIKNGFVYAQMLATAGDGSLGANLTMVTMKRARHNPPSQPAAFAQQIKVAVESATS